MCLQIQRRNCQLKLLRVPAPGHQSTLRSKNEEGVIAISGRLYIMRVSNCLAEKEGYKCEDILEVNSAERKSIGYLSFVMRC